MNWLEILTTAIPYNLPGEKVHAEMAPLSRMVSSEALLMAKTVRESAVGIHLIERENDLDILLTQRSAYEGTHGGQISFPGGKKEDSDGTLEFTARRETFEETGLPLHAGLHIGTITEVFIPVSGFRVVPHVFYHKEFNWQLEPSEREVAEIFFLPLRTLLLPELVKKKDILVQTNVRLNDVPYFAYQDYFIWGATAILLNELKHLFKNALEQNQAP